MKKTLVSALTTALVVGAASTTFAAANPFADVPADHWAYDSVAQLADAGIVDGYTDGSFKGQQGMSRYEMAQIVAKAMTKSDKADAATKAQIDKLAAEFGDELANLGVRIDSLEKKVDNVIWAGKVRYDWNRLNYDGTASRHQSDSNIKLRLEPTFAINDHWTGHARIDAKLNNTDTTASDATATMDKLWVDGVYGKTTVTVGKYGTFSTASHGLVIDTEVTGAEIAYAPTSDWAVKATVANIPASGNLFGQDGNGDNNFGRYGAIEVDYNNGKIDAGIGYHHFAATNMTDNFYAPGKTSVGVTDLGVGYKFDKNVYAFADYAFAPGFDNGTEADKRGTGHNAYNIQVQYKGADAAAPHSWGAYVAYRQLAPFASAFATQDNAEGYAGYKTLKGWEIEANYTFAKNIIGEVKYFMGKDTFAAGSSDKVKGIWTRVDFLF